MGTTSTLGAQKKAPAANVPPMNETTTINQPWKSLDRLGGVAELTRLA